METLHIQADMEMITILTRIAEDRCSKIEEIVKEALNQYLKQHSCSPKTYSFIGIGHSGKDNVSKSVEEVLQESADRYEGWSLKE